MVSQFPEMLNFHYRLLILICIVGFARVERILPFNQTNSLSKSIRIRIPVRRSSYNSSFTLDRMPRLDNRVGVGSGTIDLSGIAKPKPKCNKRIRIANGVTKFKDRGSFVRYQCSDGFTLIGSSIAVCLRDQWSFPPPICVKPGCRRILAPQNGLARLGYAGAIADFVCRPDHILEGNRVLFCDGNRWNGTEPVCVPNEPPTTTMDIREWEKPETTTEVNNELWDYNDAMSSTIQSDADFTTTTKPNDEEEPKIETTQQSKQEMRSSSVGHQEDMEATTESFAVRSSTPNRMNDLTSTHSVHVPVRATSTEHSWTTAFQESNSVDEHTTIKESSRTLIPEISLDISTSTSNEQPATEVGRKDPKLWSSNAVSPSTVPYIDGQETTTTTERRDDQARYKYTIFDEGIVAEEPFQTEKPAVVEFIQPIEPHKLDEDFDHQYYKKLTQWSLIGGVVFGAIVGMLLFGGVVTYCWRRNIGIARRNVYDSDGRTLSASDANDDFAWMDHSVSTRF